MSTISVVIPAYNADRFLGEAIDSVLAQEQSAHEIVVVNDGSSDDTCAIARSYGQRVRLISQSSAGAAAARNAGIEAATGQYLAFLDADDRMLPQRLRLQCDLLNRSPEVDLVFCLQWLFRDGQPVSPAVTASESQQRIRSGLAPGTLLARRSAFDRFGNFPAELRLGEFVVWFRRAQAAGCCHRVIEAPLTQRRIHAASLSQTKRADYALLVRTLRSGGGMAMRRAA